MASFRSRGNRYYIRFYDSSRNPKESVISLSADAWTKREAKRHKRELVVAYEKGEFDPWTDDHLKATSSSPTVKESIEAYIEEKKRAGRRGEHGGWAESTLQAKTYHLRAFAEQVGPHRPVHQLTQEDLHSYVHQEDYSVATKKAHRATINAWTRWTEYESPEPLPPIAQEPKKPAYVTEAELYKICEAHCDLMDEAQENKHASRQNQSLSQFYTTAFRFLFYEGLRRGELLNMRREHIDEPNRTLRIPKQKSGRDSVIPITPPAFSALQVLIRRDGKKIKRRAPIFDLTAPKYITYAFSNAVEKCEAITDPQRVEDLHLHSLRHSCAIYWRKKGMALADIRDLLRHSSIRTTEIYDQMVPSELSSRFESAYGAGT